MDAVRFLCIGDLHLGRRPSRLPQEWEDAGRLGPEAALERAVARAIEERVDAVLFAGDVVESREDRFEAFAVLERQMRRLVEAGVRVLGVAGNHDDLALPRLAARLEGFHLLGAGGRWECAEIGGAGGVRARVHGWSFPRPRVMESPLAGVRFERDPQAVEIGLLHADLGASTGPYAPVRREELEASGLDAFLLGHVHAPHDLAAMERPIGYLGSLAPLDPGEPGRHSAWLLEAEGPGSVRLRPVVHAALRYDAVEVALDGIDAQEDAEGALEERIDAALRTHATRLAAEAGDEEPPRALLARARLVGRSAAHGILRRAVHSERWREFELNEAGISARIERIEDRARPALDLEALARGDDPPALLARELLALERGESTGLLADSRQALRKELERREWRGIEDDVPVALDEEAVRERLARVATELLEELLAQRSTGTEAAP